MMTSTLTVDRYTRPACAVPDCTRETRATRPTCAKHDNYDVSACSVLVKCKEDGWRGIGSDLPEAVRLLDAHKAIDHGVQGQRGYR